MWTAIFTLSTLLLLALPLMPALREVWRASDAQPLRVVQEYDADVAHFANGFRKWIFQHFTAFLEQTSPADQGKLANGTAYRLIGEGEGLTLSKSERSRAVLKQVIVAQGPLHLQEGLLFESEVYSRTSIATTAHSQFRAVLAEEEITLAEGSAVMRWVHSGTQLHIGQECMLYGRASADQSMQVGHACFFERVHAPTIQFGDPYDATPLPMRPHTELHEIAHIKERFERRWLVDGTITIPAGHAVNADLVATGAIRIGHDACIKGSLKSTRDLYLGPGTHVEGAVFSNGNLHIAEGCTIGGPVVAERLLVIAQGTVIGSPERQTTVSAQRMRIAGGVVTSGTVWADMGATVMRAGEML